eukprot:350298-Chlamydomonas_euryale.AAC.2
MHAYRQAQSNPCFMQAGRKLSVRQYMHIERAHLPLPVRIVLTGAHGCVVHTAAAPQRQLPASTRTCTRTRTREFMCERVCASVSGSGCAGCAASGGVPAASVCQAVRLLRPYARRPAQLPAASACGRWVHEPAEIMCRQNKLRWTVTQCRVAKGSCGWRKEHRMQ